MSRFARLATALQATCRSLASAGLQQQVSHQVAPVAAWLRNNYYNYHTSNGTRASAPATVAGDIKPAEGKFGYLADKDIWDEAWAYEPRFGTADNPIVVPSLLAERIIGVTDPHDDTLVIWGIVREGEPPKQLVAEGEFFTLQRVDRVEKVSDKLGIADPMLS